MSLKPKKISDIPEETKRIAEKSFPKGNIYMQMRDELGTLYEDEEFASLFASCGQPAYSPWRLALVCIMQYVANLSDRQAAEAVRARIDWKYALSLELDDPGFDYSILSEFRSRLLEGGIEQHLLDAMLTRFRECGLLNKRGKQRTDSTHVMSAARVMKRIESVGETLRAALNILAVAAPEWLGQVANYDWYDRYGKRIEEYHFPKETSAREELVKTMAIDGMNLLNSVYSDNSPHWLRELPAVQNLRQKWVHQFYFIEGELRMRDIKDLPPASLRFNSPYDPEAHYSTKGSTSWHGYKVHLTETCDDDSPRLITNVHTTESTDQDVDAVAPIHESLSAKGQLPDEHIVDAGYVDSDSVVKSRNDYGVDLMGPMKTNVSWQAREGNGYSSDDFQIDWKHKKAICPQGIASDHWRPKRDRFRKPIIYICFPQAKCGICESRSLCTRSKNGYRAIGIRPQAQYEALQEARKREKTQEWKAEYTRRAGIEGTNSQGIRAFGLRRTRYTGLSKTHLQHILTAAAINVVRFSNWVSGVPLAKTRISAFEAIRPMAA